MSRQDLLPDVAIKFPAARGLYPFRVAGLILGMDHGRFIEQQTPGWLPVPGRFSR